VSYLHDRLLRYRQGLGLSFQPKDDVVRNLERDIAVLTQRKRDCLVVFPDRTDILRVLDKKREKRERQLEEARAAVRP
jgi:hypothetical protein